MITKEQAIKLGDGSLREEIHCEVVRNCKRIVGARGGITDKVVRVRPSGRCQTWKRDQARFRLPVKFGLYESGEIDDVNASSFHLASDCPITRQAEKKQLQTDVALARGLQATVNETESKLKGEVKSLERIGGDTSWDEQAEHNRDLEYESRVADEQEQTEGN